VKITKKHLRKALQALEDNEISGLEGFGVDELSELLWMALSTILSKEKKSRDHRVTLKVEALLSGLADPEEIDVTDYGIKIVSNVDAAFDMLSPHITRMEIR
jgi:hypothetical protein